MTPARWIAIAVGGLGLGLATAWYVHSPSRPVHAIDAVPPDAFVAIEVNIGALRKSGALTALFGDKDEQSLTHVCGFDPVEQMEDLVFTVPEDGSGAFGVAVQAGLTEDQLVGCANQVVKAHGGDPTSDVTKRGSYSIITPRSVTADSSKPGRSLGYKNGGPILVGPKSWLYSMVDALEDASQGRSSPGEHVTLRAKLSATITPPPTFLVTATALLEKSVRDKLKTEMLKEVGVGNDSGTAMMLGVLGMSSAVLGLYEAEGEVHAVLDLHCEEPSECAQVGRLVMKVKDDWANMAPLRAFGLGPVLEHVAVKHEENKLEVTTAAAASDVVRWAKLFIASRPIVAPIDAAGAGAPDGPPGPPGSLVTVPAASADVPTQTIHVTVPEGVGPGQPFSVTLTSPGASGSAQARVLQATVPGPTPPTQPLPPAPPTPAGLAHPP